MGSGPPRSSPTCATSPRRSSSDGLRRFWDGPNGGHICPDEQRGQKCSHLDVEQPLEGYRRLVRDRLKGTLEVAFPHADVYIFMG